MRLTRPQVRKLNRLPSLRSLTSRLHTPAEAADTWRSLLDEAEDLGVHILVSQPQRDTHEGFIQVQSETYLHDLADPSTGEVLEGSMLYRSVYTHNTGREEWVLYFS